MWLDQSTVCFLLVSLYSLTLFGGLTCHWTLEGARLGALNKWAEEKFLSDLCLISSHFGSIACISWYSAYSVYFLIFRIYILVDSRISKSWIFRFITQSFEQFLTLLSSDKIEDNSKLVQKWRVTHIYIYIYICVYIYWL